MSITYTIHTKPYRVIHYTWPSVEYCYAGRTGRSDYRTGLRFIDEDLWSGVSLG